MTTARDQLYLGIRETQTKAQSQRVTWQFSVREANGQVEWAAHPRSVETNFADWKAIEGSKNFLIDSETTFDKTPNDIRYILFDEDGNTKLHHLGRITLTSKSNSSIKRCVIASTVIGAVRTSKEQSVPKSGKTCY